MGGLIGRRALGALLLVAGACGGAEPATHTGPPPASPQEVEEVSAPEQPPELPAPSPPASPARPRIEVVYEHPTAFDLLGVDTDGHRAALWTSETDRLRTRVVVQMIDTFTGQELQRWRESVPADVLPLPGYPGWVGRFTGTIRRDVELFSGLLRDLDASQGVSDPISIGVTGGLGLVVSPDGEHSLLPHVTAADNGFDVFNRSGRRTGRVTTRTTAYTFRDPVFSPDSRNVAFGATPSGERFSVLHVGPVDGVADAVPEVSRPSRAIWLDASTLYVTSFDESPEPRACLRRVRLGTPNRVERVACVVARCCSSWLLMEPGGETAIVATMRDTNTDREYFWIHLPDGEVLGRHHVEGFNNPPVLLEGPRLVVTEMGDDWGWTLNVIDLPAGRHVRFGQDQLGGAIGAVFRAGSGGGETLFGLREPAPGRSSTRQLVRISLAR